MVKIIAIHLLFWALYLLSEYLANLDGFEPWEAGIDGIDWDNVVPRRGWKDDA